MPFKKQRKQILKEFQAFMGYQSKIPSRVVAHYLKVSHQSIVLYLRGEVLPSILTAARMAHFIQMCEKLDAIFRSLVETWEIEKPSVQHVAIKDLEDTFELKGFDWQRFHNIMAKDAERHLKRQYLVALILEEKKRLDGEDRKEEDEFLKTYKEFQQRK